MGKPFGSRTLLVICGALAILLGALAALQYRWSARVAAADAQREREHLDSAASLFADKFNTAARDTVSFLQNDAAAARQSGAPLTAVPKLIAELYYADFPEQGNPTAQKLTADGGFAPATLPDWAAAVRCSAVVMEQPLALVAPIYEATTDQVEGRTTIRIMRSIHYGAGKCFIAHLDQPYLHDTLLPELIRQSFGVTSGAAYDFAVLAGAHPIFGAALHPDLRQPFFSVMPGDLGLGRKAAFPPHPGNQGFFVARVESNIVTNGPVHFISLFGPGAWELQVAHKGMPLAEAFEQTRRLNLLLSLGVEALLLAAIIFLVVAARRMERLANQKVQFVAGVSHELRTPVSAIAMLSRNQADGLVTGADRVKQYGELIHQQSRRLNEMVEQTLQYAGIRAGRTPPARHAVDLRRLIEEAVDTRRADLARAGFEVELALGDPLPDILGDANWLRTAIDNLLSNAQKHADGGHWIRVSARHSPAAKEVTISVEDRGAGIHPADQAEIFEPFSRGRAAIEAQIPGSGLGLSLVRSAAEVHRGSVTLESEPGRGSTFTLHLPV